MTSESVRARDTEHEPLPRRGGTVAMLVDPEPPTLVAVTNCGDPSMLVSAKVTEGLLAYDFELNPKPQLAVDWSVDRQFKQFDFKLRRGVRWHDGSPFTAHDAAFSILLLKDVHARGRVTFANVEEARAVDAETLVIRLAKPAPYLLRAFAGCESPIVPRHRYEGMDPAKSPNSSAPTGTGPFIFKEWVRGSHIVYERNPAYWDDPKPYVDRLVVYFIADPERRFSAIDDGRITLAPATPVSLQQIERLKQRPGLAFDTNGYQYMNQVVRLEFNLDDPILKDVRVRRAIAHAIDRSEILQQVWRGYGAPTHRPISPALRQFQMPDGSAPTFDPQRAEHLLDEAGFPRGADGRRFRLTHDVIPAGEPYEETALHVARQLGKIGIAVTVRREEFSAYIARIYTDRAFSFVTNRANTMFDPTIGVQRLFWSKNFKAGVPFSNASHYANPEVDRLLEDAAVEPDLQRRAAQFSRFQDLIARDLPDLALLSPSQITIARTDLRDHTVTADGAAGNLADMYLIGT